MLSHRQLVEVDAIEGEVLVVDWVEGAPHHPGLHLVLLLGQQLQLDVRVAGEGEVIWRTGKLGQELD